jgi:hypothetical protein
MIDGTFAFVRGVGPAKELELRRRGIGGWEAFPAEGTVLSRALDARIRAGLVEMRQLLETGRFPEIVGRLPVREHWRLYPLLEADASFLDIETTFDGRVTVIGLYDPRRGPRLYVRGHNLSDFLEEPVPAVVLTFNGGSFDLPVLARSFPGWRPPPVHVDLRTVLAQLGERGGLKVIEERLGLGRPEHLKGVSGADAATLWDAFRRRGDTAALRQLLEYNLYDVVQLRSLAELACTRLSTRLGRPWAPRHAFRRGDVLLDVTRAVEAVAVHGRSIDPERFEDAERRPLRGGGGP